MIEVPESSPAPSHLPYASGFSVIEGGEAPCHRSEVLEGFEVRLKVFGTELVARCEAGNPPDVITWRLVDSIMEYLPEELVRVGQVSWPGCVPGHGHPPEFHAASDVCAWVCPNTHEVVIEIRPVS